ncbi:hypothetical protein [Breznakiella homolactica]|uniref:Uncharacterized protein n=1 Tax=Breznakiella homolactica TaxID=2798577 RepID=A0A7T7XNP7_9SPIR|nr:hypothetical protein [Breznakiella homolactica]QQO09700.1 hypothetical protein JFL75_01925 [Breznakiella homolactica]
MSGNGRGGNKRRRSFKNRDRETWAQDGRNRNEKPRYDKQKGVIVDRPKWAPPKVSTEPLPVPDCPICGKPIKDIASAITDKKFGQPVHFECMAAQIAAKEPLGEGDTVSYIGGGRFGILHYPNPQDRRNFQIKKVFECEDKENRAEWRKTVADRYSTT